MCQFTYTNYSCGHQSGWVADESACPRIEAEKAAGRRGFFLPCSAPDSLEDLLVDNSRVRCSICHQLFLDKLQNQFARKLAYYHDAAGNDGEVKDRINGWFDGICDQMDTLVPLWYAATENKSRDIYQEYPLWGLLQLSKLRELFTEWSSASSSTRHTTLGLYQPPQGHGFI